MRALVEKSLNDMGTSFEELTSCLDKNTTYSFELLTPINKVVVSHNDFSIKLIGARYKSGQEIDIRTLHFGIPIPMIYNFNSLNDISSFIDKLPDHNFEGFVVCDEDFNRVKIKSPKYLIAHKVASKDMNDRNLMEAILLGIEDDMIPFMAEYFVTRLNTIKANLSAYLIKSDSIFEKHKGLARKDFALAIKDSGVLSAYLFDMFSGKSKKTIDSIRSKKSSDGFAHSVLDSLLKIIGE
jgi:hypothetical protein